MTHDPFPQMFNGLPLRAVEEIAVDLMKPNRLLAGIDLPRDPPHVVAEREARKAHPAWPLHQADETDAATWEDAFLANPTMDRGDLIRWFDMAMDANSP